MASCTVINIYIITEKDLNTSDYIILNQITLEIVNPGSFYTLDVLIIMLHISHCS